MREERSWRSCFLFRPPGFLDLDVWTGLEVDGTGEEVDGEVAVEANLICDSRCRPFGIIALGELLEANAMACLEHSRHSCRTVRSIAALLSDCHFCNLSLDCQKVNPTLIATLPHYGFSDSYQLHRAGLQLLTWRLLPTTKRRRR